MDSFDLRTKGNTRYQVTQTPQGYQVQWAQGGQSKTFPGLNQALWCLGGMVAWDQWSRRSKATLMLLNDGKAI